MDEQLKSVKGLDERTYLRNMDDCGPERAAGSPQEPRSPSTPTQPTAEEPARSEAVALREHNFVSAATGKMSRVWEQEGVTFFREGGDVKFLSRTQGPEILRLAGLVEQLGDALGSLHSAVLAPGAPAWSGQVEMEWCDGLDEPLAAAEIALRAVGRLP